jgi:hypothetical protein
MKPECFQLWDLILYKNEPCFVISLFASITATSGSINLWSLKTNEALVNVNYEDIFPISIIDAHLYLLETIDVVEKELDVEGNKTAYLVSSFNEVTDDIEHYGYTIGHVLFDKKGKLLDWHEGNLCDKQMLYVHNCQHYSRLCSDDYSGDIKIRLKDDMEFSELKQTIIALSTIAKNGNNN